MKIRRILVEVDPHKDNDATLDRAVRLAKAFGASIDLFCCEYQQWLAGSAIFEKENLGRAREAYVAELERWVDSLAEPLRDAGIDVTHATAWHKPRYEALLGRADEVDADLIVRTTRKHSPLARMFLSATDWELIRRSPVSLWLVKRSGALPERVSLLAAVDPTHPEDEVMKIDRRILDCGAAFADGLGGELNVIHAFLPPMPVTADAAASAAAAVPVPQIEEDVDQVRERHKARLGQLVADYDFDDDRLHLVCGDPASAIAEFVADNDVDVVVTGAVARAWLERVMLGSTAESMLENVDSDLVVIKPE